ncbi:AAA family ATPase [Micromonospora sp. NBC_01699]|uniref:ATP-binding protein n=1 Tax=Micromonospora sp. NBC_01699 TaxID=2975984 RepID=UPI002E3014F9|nr:AAA family ATPase [Micromonospora sp. NBC_01699]
MTSPVLIGRDAEVAAISAAAGRARLGHGRAMFVTGEPGIGKSRLIREIGRSATGMAVLAGRAGGSATSMPCRPLVEALNSRLRNGPVPTDPDLEPFRPALSRLFPEWRSGTGDGSGDETGRGTGGRTGLVLAEGVLRLLAALGRERPLLLVLEDLHDADSETLDVLGYLAVNLDRLPVLLLGTLCTGPSAALDLAYRIRRDHDVPLLELATLTRADVARLAARCLDSDVADLPARLVDRLATDCDGVPFVVEELLAGMVAGGVLRRDGDRWRIDGDPVGPVPATAVRAIGDRANRLGPQGRRLLDAAAVIGGRFPLPVLRAMSDLDPGTTDELLRAATAAHLLRPDPADPDWYAFRHPLTADALLGELPQPQHARLAATAARALETRHPDLPGELCPLAARLHLAAGDNAGAARLLTRAGTRALAHGAADSAGTLLERAHHLLRRGGDDAAAVAVLDALLGALEETGEFDRARWLVDELLATAVLTTAQTIALHLRLGWMALDGGRTDEAESRLAAARMLASPDRVEQVAVIDAMRAHLLVLDGGRADEAEQLAARAVATAERVRLPELVCRTRRLLALLAGRRGCAEADQHLLDILRVAERHRLPLWQIRASVRLATHQTIRTGQGEPLRRARDAARAMGAVTSGYAADAGLALHDVLSGGYEHPVRVAGECAAAMAGIGRIGDLRYALMVGAAAYAHRAARTEMETTLAEFERRGGANSPEMAMVHGLCRAFCALLQEDRAVARSELDAARDHADRYAAVDHRYGRYGLTLLLDALSGAADHHDHRDVAADPAATPRWNRQFVHFAHAVLLGAAGEREAAEAALGRAREAAAVFPTAHRLGLRLVAESALEHGWGNPDAWLREAELYFHTIGTPLVAAACRTLIRRAGQRAPQRRTGHGGIPIRLWKQGVTVREYEVLVLLADHRANKEIARRLHLSHRTVEKHVANLLRKTDQPHRSALRAYVAVPQPS